MHAKEICLETEHGTLRGFVLVSPEQLFVFVSSGKKTFSQLMLSMKSELQEEPLCRCVLQLHGMEEEVEALVRSTAQRLAHKANRMVFLSVNLPALVPAQLKEIIPAMQAEVLSLAAQIVSGHSA